MADEKVPDDVLKALSEKSLGFAQYDSPEDHAIQSIAIELLAKRAAIEGMVKALRASGRLLAKRYVLWENAGGPNKCAHGIAEGIDCRHCDEATVLAAVTSLEDSNEC